MAISTIRLDTRNDNERTDDEQPSGCGITVRRHQGQYLLTNRGTRTAKLRGTSTVLHVGDSISIDAPIEAREFVFDCPACQ